MCYLTVKSEQDAKILQADLDKLTFWEQTWTMEFHPDKCEVISITRKRKPVLYEYTLHGQKLKHVDTVKYLGVQIAHDLRWDKHIDYITSKANSTLGFLRRNINISNPHVKEQSYQTLVRPVLEYSQTVWDPYTTAGVDRIESVQRRAARFTLCRYRRTSSVSAMLAELNWQTLAERRRLARLTMFYKIHYNLVAIIMPLSSKLYSRSTRTENILAYNIPSSRCDYHLYSFFPRTVRDWNTLPQQTVQLRTVEAFKQAIVTA